MALLFYDGFTYTDDIDDVERRGWEYITNTGSAIPHTVIAGDIDGNNAVDIRAIYSAYSYHYYGLKRTFNEQNEVVIGFSLKRPYTYPPPSSLGIFQVNIKDSSGNVYGYFEIDNSLVLNLKDSNGSIVGTNTFDNDFWEEYRYMEFRVKIGETTGEIELKINELAYPNMSQINVDTQPAGGTGMSEVAFISFRTGNPSYNTQWYIGNVYCLDTTGTAPHNTFLGICQVVTQRPDEDVPGYVDFTPSSGSDRYAMVNETTPDYSMTVNTSNDAAEKDIYSLDNPISGPGTIYAVQPICIAQKKTAGGSGAGLKPVLLCDCGPQVGNLFYPEYDDWSYNDATDLSIWVTDPDTGLAWTKGDVNTLKAGFKVGG